MWKNWLVFILGIILIFIPFLGLPLSFARATYVILGLIIALASFFSARDLHMITLHLNSLPDDQNPEESFVDESIKEIVDDAYTSETTGSNN